MKFPHNEEKLINIETAKCGSCKESREASPTQNCHPFNLSCARFCLQSESKKLPSHDLTLQYHEFSEIFPMPVAASLELPHSSIKGTKPNCSSKASFLRGSRTAERSLSTDSSPCLQGCRRLSYQSFTSNSESESPQGRRYILSNFHR
jgi:hypothetical protein